MNIRSSLFLTVAVFLLAGCVPTAMSQSSVADVARQAHAWDEAIVAKDLAGIADKLCDDFHEIGLDGEVTNREGFLRNTMSMDLELDPHEAEDQDVQVYGDAALLTARTQVKGRYAGTPFTLRYRYSQLYVRLQGRWKVCAVQMTPLGPR